MEQGAHEYSAGLVRLSSLFGLIDLLLFKAASWLQRSMPLRCLNPCQRKLMGKVGAKLIRRDPTNGRRGFEDCASFYERIFNALTSAGDEPRFVGSDALGSWVFSNVLGRPPESDA